MYPEMNLGDEILLSGDLHFSSASCMSIDEVSADCKACYLKFLFSR